VSCGPSRASAASAAAGGRAGERDPRGQREAAASDETDAGAAAGAAPDAARYPRLIWVSDEAPGLEFPVRDASLTQP